MDNDSLYISISPDIDVINNVLRMHYNFDISKITEAPRGFVAQTFYVYTKQNKYFLKIVRNSIYSENLERSLPSVRNLFDLGVDRISYPISTREEKLSVLNGKDHYVVFNCIEGNWTFDYDKEKYITLLAQIHSKTKDLTYLPSEENFSPSFLAKLQQKFACLFSKNAKDKYIQELYSLLLPYHDELERDIKSFEITADNLKSRHNDLYITHGDAPGNIIKSGNGDVYLIDWDDTLLAPRERDTWFHLKNYKKNEFETFFNKYYDLFPDYKLDMLAYTYYLYQRYFADLEGFMEVIMFPGSPTEKKISSLKQIQNDCFEWTRPAIRTMD